MELLFDEFIKSYIPTITVYLMYSYHVITTMYSCNIVAKMRLFNYDNYSRYNVIH